MSKTYLIIINAAICLFLLIMGGYVITQADNSLFVSSRILAAGVILSIVSLIVWLNYYSLRSTKAARSLKYLKLFSGLLFLYIGLTVVINWGVYAGPFSRRVESSKRLAAVLLGVGLVLLAVWLLRVLAGKKRYVAITLASILVFMTQIPIGSYFYKGVCDIMPKYKRLSLILGGSLKEPKSKPAGGCHSVDYTLFIL